MKIITLQSIKIFPKTYFYICLWNAKIIPQKKFFYLVNICIMSVATFFLYRSITKNKTVDYLHIGNILTKSLLFIAKV